jgi:hypothetical protein
LDWSAFLVSGAWRCDIEGLLTGLITLLVVAIIIAIVCYIVARLVAQFMPGAAPYVWIIWAIGGLIVLIFVLRLFGPALGVKL